MCARRLAPDLLRVLGNVDFGPVVRDAGSPVVSSVDDTIVHRA